MADEARMRTAEMWSLGDYPALAELLEPAARALVAALAVAPLERVLDVAAGNGNVALIAARAGALVAASDLTPRMVALGRERTAAAGLDVAWQEADVVELPYPDAEADVVVSGFGLIFAPDPAAATAEVARVLRPGGRLGLTAWPRTGPIARQVELLNRHFPPELQRSGPFPWSDPDEIAAYLAGPFSDVRVSSGALSWRAPSAAAFTERMARDSPSHVAAAHVLGDRAPAAFAELRDLVAEYAAADGSVDLAVEYLLVTAVRR